MNDASLVWYKWVKNVLYENGGDLSITDPVLFMWHHNMKFIGVMTVHVDFLCARTVILS